nr:hypothetical protein [Tanacetum cinerariifolium]
MSSSTVTYTSIYTDSVPGRVYWGADEELSDGGPEHPLSPNYVPGPEHLPSLIESEVTYTSKSSDSDGPSWGTPLMNASEFPKMDPYEEVTKQGHVHLLSPAYVPDPMELDEHVPVHVPKPEQPEYH